MRMVDVDLHSLSLLLSDPSGVQQSSALDRNTVTPSAPYLQAASAGAKRRSPNTSSDGSKVEEAPVTAPEALFQRLTLAAPVPAPDEEDAIPARPPAEATSIKSNDAGDFEARNPESTISSPASRGKQVKRHTGVHGDSGAEVSVPADGASWRLPLAAADAPYAVQEVRPLGRSAEGANIGEAPAELLPVITVSHPGESTSRRHSGWLEPRALRA